MKKKIIKEKNYKVKLIDYPFKLFITRASNDEILFESDELVVKKKFFNKSFQINI